MTEFFETGFHGHAVIATEPEFVRLKYVDLEPPQCSKPQGIIVLIHGFPQTGYQFRKVIRPLAQAGYRVIVPDFRGQGDSSKPMNLDGYRKVVIAEDIRKLIRNHLGIKDNVCVIGHDIGGMIAAAFAFSFPEDTASVIWGECPLPGTSFYEEIKTKPVVFHFLFHQQLDLPEALTAGRERYYLKHFFDKQAYNAAAITPQDLDFYEKQYAQPGGMRCGFNSYRLFEEDAKDNRRICKEKGKCKVRCLGLNGSASFLSEKAEDECAEFYESFEVATVEKSGHWIAEENPEGFVREILKFIRKQE